MNSHTNPTTLTGTPCGCTGASSKTCKCGGGACDCRGACQVDTLTRPRFFAGQLLTEDDLQSLEDYVVAKNRLHNRYFFGSGVVCGLDVFCEPCGGGSVAVQPGYALDCCGNDIVLACRVTLDINAMVRDLRRDMLGGYDCGDPCAELQQQLSSSQEALAREYCLYVRYCEQEADPVSPYVVDQPCTPQTCEPTRIREGVRFELRCPQPAAQPVDLLQAIENCFQDVLGLEKMSADMLSLAEFDRQTTAVLDSLKTKSFEDLRSRLLVLIDRSPHPVHCKLRDKVLALQPPAPSPTPAPSSPAPEPAPIVTAPTAKPDTPAGGLADAAAPAPAPAVPPENAALIEILVGILKDCVCMALNPPCEPCNDTGVLLACLKIKDCEVVEICNLDRRFVITPAALRYWLSFGEIEAVLRQFCCLEKQTDLPGLPAPIPQVAEPAMRLRGIFTGLAAIQPARSEQAMSFMRVARAFGELAQSPTDDTTTAEIPPQVLREAVATEVNATFGDKLAAAQKAIDQISELQAQVKALSDQIATRTRRAAGPGPGPGGAKTGGSSRSKTPGG